MPKTPGSSRLRALTPLLALWLVVLAGYWNALSVPFVWDDHHFVGEDSRIARGATSTGSLLTTTFWDLPEDRTGSQAYYRPLVQLSFQSDYHIWDGDPFGFHLANVLLHLLVCTLAYLVCRQLGVSAAGSLAAAALFGVFPRSTEAVTFVSGRTDLLATAGALGALALYRCERQQVAWRLASAAVLFLGLLGKEVAVAAVAALVAWEWARRPPDWQRAVANLTPALGACLLYLALRLRSGAQLEEAGFLVWPERGLYVLQALGHYLWMLATPWSPQMFIGTLGEPEWDKVLLGLIPLATAVAALIGLGRRRFEPLVAALACLAIFGLLPVLHIVPLPLRAVAADRFLYLPLAALVALAARRLDAGAPVLRRAAAVLVVPLLAGFVWGSHQRNIDWNDELRLWRVTARDMPPYCGAAEFELGSFYSKRGQSEPAILHYRRAYHLDSEFARRHPGAGIPISLLSSLGLVLSERGQLDEALPILQKLVEIDPETPVNRLHYGSALSRKLEFERADEQLQKALQLYPGYPQAEFMLNQNRQAWRLWQKLPAASAAESSDTLATRAMVYFLVGRVGKANELWLALLARPELPAPILARARWVLEQQRRVFGSTPEVQELARTLEAR
jgi:tetratricopeptide (TPR) repeat protein